MAKDKSEDKTVDVKKDVTPEQDPGAPTPEAVAAPDLAGEVEDTRKFVWVDLKGANHDIIIRKPTAEEIQSSDWEYARVFNEAIAEGIVPRAALVSLLKDRGVDFDTKNVELDSMRTELNVVVDELEVARKSKDKAKVSDLKDDITDMRSRMINKRAALNDYVRNSAESMANDARDVFVLATILEENGQPFFRDSNPNANIRVRMRERLKKLQKEEYSTLRLQGSYQFMTFANGLSADFMEQFPEKQKETWDK